MPEPNVSNLATSLANPPLAAGAVWNKTGRVISRLQNSGRLKDGAYQGRPIIGRDRPIDGGVYLGESPREAIVVDGNNDQHIGPVYEELLNRLRVAHQHQGARFKQNLLTEVWSLVKEIIPYDRNNVNRILQKLPNPDTKIYLSSFFGGGVCRHQALLAAYLLERLSKDGVVRGKVSVDRNYIPNMGGHAWVRYINSAGEVFILDPAQNFSGRLDQTPNQRDRWLYERPEDTSSALRLFSKLKRVLGGFLGGLK